MNLAIPFSSLPIFRSFKANYLLTTVLDAGLKSCHSSKLSSYLAWSRRWLPKEQIWIETALLEASIHKEGADSPVLRYLSVFRKRTDRWGRSVLCRMVRGLKIILLGENSVGQETLPPLMKACSMRPQKAHKHSFREEFLFVKGRTVFPIRAVGKCAKGANAPVSAVSFTGACVIVSSWRAPWKRWTRS